MSLDRIGDTETFFYIQRQWIDENGNPMDCASDDEWDTVEEACRAAKNPPEGMTISVIKATHTVVNCFGNNEGR